MKKLRISFTLVLVFLTACTSLPQGPETSVLLAKTSLTSAYDTLTVLALEKRITKAEGQSYLVTLGQVREGLDAAQNYAIAGDANTSALKLSVATALLKRVREELIKREAQKGVK